MQNKCVTIALRKVEHRQENMAKLGGLKRTKLLFISKILEINYAITMKPFSK